MAENAFRKRSRIFKLTGIATGDQARAAVSNRATKWTAVKISTRSFYSQTVFKVRLLVRASSDKLGFDAWNRNPPASVGPRITPQVFEAALSFLTSIFSFLKHICAVHCGFYALKKVTRKARHTAGTILTSLCTGLARGGVKVPRKGKGALDAT